MAKPLLDTLLRGNVLLQRLASGEAARFAPFLRKLDSVLRTQLSGDALTEYSRRRLEELLGFTAKLLSGVITDFTDQVVDTLVDVGSSEAGFSARALKIVEVTSAVPSLAQLRTAILKNPLTATGPSGGKLMQQFIDDWSRAQVDTLTGAIRRGVYQGQTNAQILTTLRGTRARNYADGMLNVTGRTATQIVRTALQHAASQAREETLAQNGDVIKAVQWLATLDKRTCPQCAALDLRVFKLGVGPRPPIHIQCRCTVIPLLEEEFARLAKGAQRAAKGASGGTQVDAGLSYYQWLKGQPADFQDEAIGAARAKLLRDGGLSAQRFAAMQLDKNFAPLTLEEMRRLEPLAFRRAGV